MKNTLVAIVGILLFLFALVSKNTLIKSEKEAVLKDKEETSYGMVEGPPPCSWDAESPDRVLSENKSQAILIKVKNETDEECQSAVSLRSPGFDMSPAKEEQTIILKSKQDGSVSWIISPRKTGSYEIAVSDSLNTKVFGINVTNMFGLSAVQAKTASFLGTLFGPMLTIPWWWEKWFQKRRQQNSSTKTEPEQTEK